VRLRPDQYENLKKWKCSCDVFVNYLGDICIRQFERDPPDHGRGVIIGTTDWFESYDRDKEGYPVFQGTRGVCVKINSSPPPITSPSLLSDMLGKTTRSLKKLFIDGTDQPLLKVMSRRLELYARGAELDRKHEVFQLRSRQLLILGTALKENLELIESHSARLGESESISGSSSAEVKVFQKLIHDLTEANTNLKRLQESIEIPSFDPETYRSERAHVERETGKLSRLLENMSL
jgi:hypothetical protein